MPLGKLHDERRLVGVRVRPTCVPPSGRWRRRVGRQRLRGAQQSRGRGHGGRVEAAAEAHPDPAAAPEPGGHGGIERLAELSLIGGGRTEVHDLVGVGAPPAPLPNSGGRYPRRGSGRQPADALDQRALRRQEGERLRGAGDVQPVADPVQRGEREGRRGEGHDAPPLVDDQRSHAAVIAREQDSAAPPVHDCERELADDAVRQRVAPALVRGQDEGAIRHRRVVREPEPWRELSPVVHSEVSNQNERSVRAQRGLAVGGVLGRAPAQHGRHRHAAPSGRPRPPPAAVGAKRSQCANHAAEVGLAPGAPVQPDDSADGAHRAPNLAQRRGLTRLVPTRRPT